jgi:hypothetical protein
VRDPGGMVWGHPRGTEETIMLSSGFEDSGVESGTHVMFDCQPMESHSLTQAHWGDKPLFALER